MGGRARLGELLVSQGFLNPEQLVTALAEQERQGGPLGSLLVRLGLVAEDDLVRTLAGELRLPVARIRGKRVNAEILELVPVEVAEKYRCLPLFLREEGGVKTLFLALEDPTDRLALDELAYQLGERVSPVLVGPGELEDALRRHYHARSPTSALGELSPMTPREAPPPAATPHEREDTETAPQLPPPDPLLHPEPQPNEDTEPEFGEPDGGAAPSPRAEALQPQLILRALFQLLVEKGIVGRDEFAARLRKLAAAEHDAEEPRVRPPPSG